MHDPHPRVFTHQSVQLGAISVDLGDVNWAEVRVVANVSKGLVYVQNDIVWGIIILKAFFVERHIWREAIRVEIELI